MLGKEAALFVPTGTQSNLCALMSHCQRGDEYIVGQMAHTYRWEGGGARGARQHPAAADRPPGRRHAGAGRHRGRIKPDDAHFARTRLLAWRTPGAARCCRMAYLERRDRAGPAARPGHPPRRRAAVQRRGRRWAAIRAPTRGRSRDHFDSVSVCFSKGLGAPVGSALCGSAELIARAHRVRKMVGGGMRQAGVLAAAALHALDHHVDRLADDHANARRLADGLQGLPGVSGAAAADQHRVRRPGARDAPPAPSSALRAAGVLCTGLYRLRLVTHLDVDRRRHRPRHRRAARTLMTDVSGARPCPSPTPKR